MTPHDLLVIGGGPAGSAAAYWAASAGLDVVVVEKKAFPREKTCGDGLTPRAVKALQDMGLGERLEQFHRFDGLRALGHGRSLELRWPQHSLYPSYGYVVRRCDLDTFVAENAEAAGATLRQGAEALAPVFEDGRLVGAVVKDKETGESSEIRARYVVIADGANSRFGRALGCTRNKSYPQGMAIRTYYESPLHDDPWIESSLDVRDRAGKSLPGYGWIFPVGNGTINVGVGLLSTFKDFKTINTSHLMTEFAATLPSYWGIDPEHPTQAPTGGRLPMGGAINPKVGANWCVVGDAAGSINPFNGEGIDYAYETGRMAASLIIECMAANDDRPAGPLPRPARRGVRPVLQGRPIVRPGDRPPGAHARADPGRDEIANAHGLGPADHGEPPARRRAGPGRGRVPDRGPTGEHRAGARQRVTGLPHRRATGLIALVVLAIGLSSIAACSSDDSGSKASSTSSTSAPSDPTATLPFATTSKDEIGTKADLAFPPSTSDFLSAQLTNRRQLDVTFTMAKPDEVAFEQASKLAPKAGKRVVTHASPLWKLNPGTEIRGTSDTITNADGVKLHRDYEATDEGDRVRVRLVLTTA